MNAQIVVLVLASVMGAGLHFPRVVLDDSCIAYERGVGDIDGDGSYSAVSTMQGIYYFAVPAANPAGGNWPRAFVASNDSDEGIGMAIADGAKVIILDTDHLWGVGGTVPWVWKSLLRGLHPIWTDPLDEASVWEPTPANAEAVRNNLGDARRFAERMNLAALKPRPKLASTGYCLASASVAYLVYQPKPAEGFSVEVKAGTYWYQWSDPTQGAITDTGRRDV